MDQSEAPLLAALRDYHRCDRYGFTPPGHRQGRATDPRVIEVLGREPFLDDVLASRRWDSERHFSHRAIRPPTGYRPTANSTSA
ncbi:hypothetical protein ACX9NE_22065 [Mycobacterium sp. ML4]